MCFSISVYSVICNFSGNSVLNILSYVNISVRRSHFGTCLCAIPSSCRSISTLVNHSHLIFLLKMYKLRSCGQFLCANSCNVTIEGNHIFSKCDHYLFHLNLHQCCLLYSLFIRTKIFLRIFLSLVCSFLVRP